MTAGALNIGAVDGNSRHESVDTITGSVPISEFNKEEKEWRLALDTGKDIDVFKRDFKKKNQMWTKGKIISMTGTNITDLTKKKFTVNFHQDVGMSEVRYNADSSFIAPYGTMSLSQNWRDELKKKDEVDA